MSGCGQGGGRRSDLKGKENSARSPDAKGRAGLSGYLFGGDKNNSFCGCGWECSAVGLCALRGAAPLRAPLAGDALGCADGNLEVPGSPLPRACFGTCSGGCPVCALGIRRLDSVSQPEFLNRKNNLVLCFSHAFCVTVSEFCKALAAW